jgi:gliding motility-associated-like protein
MRLIHLIFLFFALTTPYFTLAQECACVNCPIDIPDNGKTEARIEIKNATNNTLGGAGQGVCQVRVRFKHEYIGDLKIDLISPAGDRVTLVGSIGLKEIRTSSASWNVTFVNQSKFIAMPDGGIQSAAWTNNDGWGVIGAYKGSYYPNTGKLDNLIKGTVNGTWKLEATDGSAQDIGSILDAQITFCDMTGIDCNTCVPNAGVLSPAFLPSFCEKTIDLSKIDLKSIYTGTPPNPSNFKYKYIVARNDTILDITDKVDLSAQIGGIYSIFGLSYLIKDLAKIPKPDGKLTAAALATQLKSATPPFCGDMSAKSSLQQIVTYPIAKITADATVLTCTQKNIAISVGSSSKGSDIQYRWTGTFLPPQGGATASGYLAQTLKDAGKYELSVARLINPADVSSGTCVTKDAVQVTIDTIRPALVASVDSILTCSAKIVSINATSSAIGANIIYDWKTIDGGIFSGADTRRLWVNKAGNYVFTIKNTKTNCVSTKTVAVKQDIVKPIVKIVKPSDSLYCSRPTINLDATGSATGNMTYRWASLNGHFTAPTNALKSIADKTGEYWFSVKNNDNACTDSLLMTIFEDKTPPIVRIATPDTVNCRKASINLDGNLSSKGTNFTYIWSGGTVISGGNTPIAKTSTAGNYTLSIKNTTNGCENKASTTVLKDIAPPTATIVKPDILTCANSFISLDATDGSTGKNFRYLWTTANGRIRDGADTPQPAVDEQGIYTIKVSNIVNGCSKEATTLVLKDKTLPIAEAGKTARLNCNITKIDLNGVGSSVGATIKYAWTTLLGKITKGETTIAPTVEDAGLYRLVVTNATNGCTASDTVSVLQNIKKPIAIATPNSAITCTNKTVGLDANGSSSGANFTTLWETIDGNFISVDKTQPKVTVNKAGTYKVNIIDKTNGCNAEATIKVQSDTELPIAKAGNAAKIDCITNSVRLDGSASSVGTSLLYTWTTRGGNIASGKNGIQPIVDAGGVYFLNVTNAANNCQAIDSVKVTKDANAPIVNTGKSELINCQNPSVTLNATASSKGNNFTYNWTTADGNIVSGATTLQPIINKKGTYKLAILNIDNQCSSTSSIDIQLDTLKPTVMTDTEGILNCKNTNIQLNATGSSRNARISLEWLTKNGTIVAGKNTYIATVNATGDYTFRLTDTLNKCVTEKVVIVKKDTEKPVTKAGEDVLLNCSIKEMNLDATKSAVGANYTTTWVTDKGNIVSGEKTLTPKIDRAGKYILNIFNTINFCSASDTLEVKQDANSPILKISPNDTLTCSKIEAILDATGSSSGADFIYEWSAKTGRLVENSAALRSKTAFPDSYTFKITNIKNNCTTSATTQILENKRAPKADAGADKLLTCSLDTAKITAAASEQGSFIQYHWEGIGINTATQNAVNQLITKQGLYKLTVKDTRNNCTATDEIDIKEDKQKPTLAATGGTLDCINASVQLKANSTTSGVSYKWTGANNYLSIIQNPIINEAGKYLLTAKSLNGCTDTLSVFVRDNGEKPNLTARGDTLTCVKKSAQLTAASTVAGVTYTWTGQNGVISTQKSPDVTEIGNYTVTIIAPNGCKASKNVTLSSNTTAPTVTLSGGAITCGNETVTLLPNTNAQKLQYQWSGPSNFSFNEKNPTVRIPGNYSVTVTGENGCKNIADVQVVRRDDAPLAKIIAPSEYDCTKTRIELDASGSANGKNINYKWTTNDGYIFSGKNTLRPLVATYGTYKLSLIDTVSKCNGNTSFTLPNLEDRPNQTNISIKQPDCDAKNGGSVSFLTIAGGKPPYKYALDNEEKYIDIPQFNNLIGGEHSIFIKDAKGCKAEKIVSINTPQPITIDLGKDKFIKYGDIAQLVAATNLPDSLIKSIFWTDKLPKSCPDCLQPSVKPTETATYSVLMTTKQGCRATARITVYVKKEFPVYFPNVFSPDGNGENDVFTLYAGKTVTKIKMFKIFNRWGELVHQAANFQPADNINAGWDGTLNGKPLNPAVFIYVAEVEFLDGSVQVMQGDVLLVR